MGPANDSMMVRLLPVFFALMLTSIQAASQVSADEICPREFLATRTGQESCWVRYHLSQSRLVCMRHDQWLNRLKQENPSSFCGDWPGRWRAISPPLNAVQKNGTDLMKKRIFFTLKAFELSPSRILKEGTSALGRFYWARRLCQGIEKIRERISSLIAPGDRFGIFRELLLGEGRPQSILPFLRILGFVHVFTASGIHLYSLALFSHRFCFGLTRLLQIPVSWGLMLARVMSFFSWVFVWVLCGMRPGMLRPWIVVTARSVAKVFGFRWYFAAPLGVALIADFLVALIRGSEWAPGRVHYALAVGGGLLAVEWGKDGKNKIKNKIKRRGLKNIRALLYDHLMLAVGSWLFTAALDAWHFGYIALATPVLSLITLPLLSGFFYPASLFAIILIFLDLSPLSQTIFYFITSWGTVLVQHLVLFCFPHATMLDMKMVVTALVCVQLIIPLKKVYNLDASRAVMLDAAAM